MAFEKPPVTMFERYIYAIVAVNLTLIMVDLIFLGVYLYGLVT